MNRPSMVRVPLRSLSVAVVALGSACTGVIATAPGEAADSPGSNAGGSGLDNGAAGNATAAPSAMSGPRCKPGVVSVGADRLQRLTRSRYNNTVRDLLGDKTAPADGFPSDEIDPTSGFIANATFVVGRAHVESYHAAARSLAATAVTTNLRAILPCDPAAIGESACADSFISVFGRRAYRRPLTPTEQASVRRLYNAGATFTDGIRLVITGLLESPYFLYRLEVGSPDPNAGGGMRLDGNEMASRLSYFLWDTMPDTDLFKAADAGQLTTVDGVVTQARRLLASSRAKAAVVSLHTQWLELGDLSTLGKDAKVYSSFTPELRNAMRTETENFLDYVVRTGDGTLTSLLAPARPWTFADSGLAKLYGVDPAQSRMNLQPAPTLPAGFAPVALDATTRAGLLTQASILATHGKPDRSDPVARGRLLRKQVLCQALPPPPPNVPPLAAPTAALTLRDQMAAHRSNPACAGCHTLIDPLGFGLEQYDGIGRFTTLDRFGKAIDARGEITGTDVDGSFEGGAVLSKRLLGSEEVRGCVAKEWFRYALGRAETDADACTVDGLTSKLEETDSLRELVIALAGSNAFRYVGAGAQ